MIQEKEFQDLIRNLFEETKSFTSIKLNKVKNQLITINLEDFMENIYFFSPSEFSKKLDNLKRAREKFSIDFKFVLPGNLSDIKKKDINFL